MKIQIIHREDKPYYEREGVDILIDGVIVTGIATHSDCPEDNSVERLGISHSFESIAKALCPDAEIEHVTRPFDDD